jgi:hypothetical protein
MKRLMSAVSIVVALSTSSAQSQSADDPAHYGGVVFVSQSGDDAIPLQAGYTPVDKSKTLNCKSISGCVITFSGMMYRDNGTQAAICGFVDGNQASPTCLEEGSANVLNSHQRAVVSQGAHAVQTTMYARSAGGIVSNWETEYTMYELHPRN